MTVRSPSRSARSSPTGVLIATVGVPVSVLAALGVVMDPWLASAALSLARDVGDNCDPACVVAALSAAAGVAAALPLGEEARREAEAYRDRRQRAADERMGYEGPTYPYIPPHPERRLPTETAPSPPVDGEPGPLGPTDLGWWRDRVGLMLDSGSVGGIGLGGDPSVGGDWG